MISEAQILDVVTRAPSEEWGERWLIARRCAEAFDPERGEFTHLVSRVLRFRRIDRLKRESSRAELFKGYIDERRAEIRAEVRSGVRRASRAMEEAPALHPADRELAGLRARGLSVRQIGVVLGIPAGTVKSELHRMRVRARRSAGLPGGGGGGFRKRPPTGRTE